MMEVQKPTPHEDQHKAPSIDLITLPPELVQIIASHLSLPDKCCLLLCNHYIFAAIGKGVLSDLQPGTNEEEGDRERFVTRLTRDLPSQFFCHNCSRIHSQDRVGPPGPAMQPQHRLPCPASPRETILRYMLIAHPYPRLNRYLLTFSHVQLAMKRHRHGPKHGVSTDSLTFVSVHILDNDPNGKRMTTLLSVEARIISHPESFGLRIQTWALLKSTKIDELLSASRFVMICDHILGSDISRLIEAEIGPYKTKIETSVTIDLLRCRQCGTEYQIQLRMLGEEGLALVITKWLDLGLGLTPNDIKWRYLRAEYRKEAISELPENIRRRFESVSALSQDALSSRNASYLLEDRFMKVMDWWEDWSWILQAGERLPFVESAKRWLRWVLMSPFFWITLCVLCRTYLKYKPFRA